jgi:hypothetical protein
MVVGDFPLDGKIVVITGAGSGEAIRSMGTAEVA